MCEPGTKTVSAVRQPSGLGRVGAWALLGLLLGACGAGASASSAPAPSSRPGTAAEVRSFRHGSSRLVVGSGAPRHRARDVLVLEGEAQLLEAKLAYGPADKDLHDEDVDVLLVPDEAGPVRRLGTVRTSEDGRGDDGGRARLRLEGGAALPAGRHRVRFVVRGDGSEVDGVVAVVPRGAPVFVSDVDGTLTSGEWAELPAALVGRLPAAHPGAARILGALASRGLLPVYLTARPEWLVPRTRAFLAANGFPEGVLFTKRDRSGAFGDAAAAYKRQVLGELGARVRLA